MVFLGPADSVRSSGRQLGVVSRNVPANPDRAQNEETTFRNERKTPPEYTEGIVRGTIWRQLQMLFSDSIVFLVSLYIGFLFGIL
jgi:hypothetical protein